MLSHLNFVWEVENEMKEEPIFFIRARHTFVGLLFLICAIVTGYYATTNMRFPNDLRLTTAQEMKALGDIQPACEVYASLSETMLGGIQATGKDLMQEQSTAKSEPSLFNNLLLDLTNGTPSAPGTNAKAFSGFGLTSRKPMANNHIIPETELVPCGMSVGVKINTAGVVVLGIGPVDGPDGKQHNPSEGILKSGDVILKANNQPLSNKEELNSIIQNSKNSLNLQIQRKEGVVNAEIKPVAGKDGRENKIGAWVRDGTQGIGTITYYNPATNKFAALGHGIIDVDTKQMLTIKNGEIKHTDITSVVKGKKGAPGELIGETKGRHVIGRIEQNSPYGIFGTVDMQARNQMPKEKLPIGLQGTIHPGPATILATVDGSKAERYDIYIESVNQSAGDDTKGMVIRITDPHLLAITNGIVQGMSGSPIIQDGHLIGAVTHVFVQEPSKGYGIFIENMLKHELS